MSKYGAQPWTSMDFDKIVAGDYDPTTTVPPDETDSTYAAGEEIEAVLTTGHVLREVPIFVVVAGFFGNEQIEYTQRHAAKTESLHAFVDVNDQEQWDNIVEPLVDGILAENDRTYRFDLHGMAQLPRVYTYTPEAQVPSYIWHTDYGETDRTKLSCVVMLEPALDGGQWVTTLNGQEEYVDLDPGDALIYPGYQVHRIEPIRQGRRQALVAWMYGPEWR